MSNGRSRPGPRPVIGVVLGADAALFDSAALSRAVDVQGIADLLNAFQQNPMTDASHSTYAVG
ncbi:MAG: hypothetical protein VX733_07870 [Candidatus Latescibacterota bacterium]|nr:hypothetical protein [Candidatus Latescibacterota bacterium]